MKNIMTADTKEFYMLIYKTKPEHKNAPKIIYIKDELMELPIEKLKDFYTYLIKSDQYYQNGFLSLQALDKAKKDFVRRMAEKYLTDNNAEEKSSTMVFKIASVYETVKHGSMQDLDNWAKTLDLNKIKNGKTGDRLFSNEEKEVLLSVGILKCFDIYAQSGRVVLKERLFDEFKSILIRKILKQNATDNIQIGHNPDRTNGNMPATVSDLVRGMPQTSGSNGKSKIKLFVSQ